MRRIAMLTLATSLLAMLASFGRCEDLLQKVAVQVLADKFKIDLNQLEVLRTRSKESAADLAPYAAGAYHFRSTDRVWALRRQGLGWGQVAHKLGMHPGTFNKLRNSGAFDKGRIWGDVFKGRYGAREQDLVVLRRRTPRLEEILGAVIVAKATGKSPQEVYDRYEDLKSWPGTAKAFGVDMEKAARVGEEAPELPAGPPVGKGKGKGKGKGGGGG
jgi:hypothetical protein